MYRCETSTINKGNGRKNRELQDEVPQKNV